MTPNFDQFRLNAETVAAFAGFPVPQEGFVYADGVEEGCDKCGQDITEVEIERNAGICDPCAKYSEPT